MSQGAFCSAEGTTLSVEDAKEYESGEDNEVVYDDDAITLLTTYHCQNDNGVPCRLNRWGRQLRVMSARMQIQWLSHVSLVKKITHLLSVYLTTLIHRISQFYSTLKPVCWQYSADCYVFAIRQILI